MHAQCVGGCSCVDTCLEGLAAKRCCCLILSTIFGVSNILDLSQYRIIASSWVLIAIFSFFASRYVRDTRDIWLNPFAFGS